MKKIGSFDEFDVYKLDDSNVYIQFKESRDVYTIFEEGKLTKIADSFRDKVFI
jgi:hypothetical protein